ncbi:DNA-binding NarL/FixJ family response regulator [Leucobacter exalbidus]|uniref:DNA-binding NarL/FixJ family response regulator n=1 Tax=Leucobacter exalbidus TaxID=662960 RepID=A0A940PNI5_9MICO|nr:response regulator transcription factor [Leucobacter exalbidus]MBP1326423.1 DNA-binding NarL/FixJ family response regulator [Leucobacter exalbidus]
MIRVLVVDDQALVRSGFRIILETEPDIEVVGEAADGAEAVQLAAALTPDVICMDVEMPGLDGIEASKRILGSARSGNSGNSGNSGKSAPPAILILTTFGHEQYLFDALAAGVSGFLVKTARAEQLIDAVHELAAGGALLGPDVTRAVMERAAQRDAAAAGGTAAGGTAAGGTAGSGAASCPLDAAGLTEREREVLRWLATGASNAEIAAALFVGEATVKTHVSNLLQKLGARDRIQAVVWAHTHGIEPHE